MTNLQFNEQNYPRQNLDTQSDSGMIQWLLNKGVVNNKKQAQLVLLGIVVAIFILITIIIFNNNTRKIPELQNDPITGSQIIPGQVRGEI